MIDIEALAAPAFMVDISADGLPAGTRLNMPGQMSPGLARCLAEMPTEGWATTLGGLQRRWADTSVVEMKLARSEDREGSCWWASLVPVVDQNGRTEALLGICREDQRTGREVAHGAGHLSLALQAIHGAEWRFDVARGVYEGSDEIATLIGEAVPRPVTWAEWLERVHPQDLGPFLSGPEPDGAVEFRFHAAGGDLRWARCSRVAVTDGAGAVEAVLGIMVDITPERVRETAWAELATHDPLTGLLNRRGLRQEIERLQPERCRTSCLALFAVDLDHFKGTNDMHGHAAGDAVLVEVARRINSTLGEGTCARLGGDEFVAVLPVSDETEAQEMRVRLQQAFRRPLAHRGYWLPVSASVGLACAPGAADIARLMDDADADLYARKRTTAYAQSIAA